MRLVLICAVLILGLAPSSAPADFHVFAGSATPAGTLANGTTPGPLVGVGLSTPPGRRLTVGIEALIRFIGDDETDESRIGAAVSENVGEEILVERGFGTVDFMAFATLEAFPAGRSTPYLKAFAGLMRESVDASFTSTASQVTTTATRESSHPAFGAGVGMRFWRTEKTSGFAEFLLIDSLHQNGHGTVKAQFLVDLRAGVSFEIF